MVLEKMAQRKGEMTDMRPSGGGKTRLTFSPQAPLIGSHGAARAARREGEGRTRAYAPAA